ncbi:hypothetical protein M0722_17810 [Microbacterium sp. KSW4-16]|uniref:hypothetical protein n=1 Tax=Microbacterium aurugineum TaxID=2851642 RepID=UPI0020C0BE34|nr:hypothetical protein [Microbacterium aurugineum]MCK8469056.1 hypothetical protein [Microbacterium aurugineum]
MTETKSGAKWESIKLQIQDDLRDAPVMSKIALEKILSRDKDDSPDVVSAGRVGRRQGNVSELTVMADVKPGGAHHLRAILKLIGGKMTGAKEVGSVHDMRFVIFDDDKKILFCTAYDGDWDSYINDFATKIPDLMDLLFANIEGWPGISDPSVKDFIAGLQLTADGWYVDAPELTVVETRRMQRNQRLLDAFVDDYSKRETKPAAEMSEEELRASHEELERFLSKVGPGGTGTA